MRIFSAWDWAVIWAFVVAIVALAFWATKLWYEIHDGLFY
jgi:hypothetical protein